ncbi:MAG: nucleoside monophosphate kinase [bacterium]|nr:nucleoside monophosphate kinase [bacterium]
MKNLILLAVQGAGKGTLAKSLIDKFGYAHISTGDLLRERSSIDDDLGREIKNLIDNGIFAPNDIIFKAIEDKITKEECKNGYILDGFPRNIEQAKGYDEILKKLNKDIGIVLNLTIPEDLLIKRITGRRMCKDCGAIYNIYSDDPNLLPEKDNVCNKCNGELYQRADDNEEAMKTRVNTYYKVTAPLIDYYKEKGILYEIDSTEAPKTLAQVEELLKKLGE